MFPLGYSDVLLRLGAAAAVGALIGFDREVRDKPAGLRTMALVALGSAGFVLISIDGGAESISRAIQGVATGVGFLGAGTIVRGRGGQQNVQGLTTAASIWLSSAAGMACALAAWPVVVVGSGLGLVILLLSPFERWLKGKL